MLNVVRHISQPTCVVKNMLCGKKVTDPVSSPALHWYDQIRFKPDPSSMLSETSGRKMHKSSERSWILAPTALVVKTKLYKIQIFSSYGNGHLALEVGDNGPLANKPSNNQNRSKLLRISGAVGVARTVCGFVLGN